MRLARSCLNSWKPPRGRPGLGHRLIFAFSGDHRRIRALATPQIYFRRPVKILRPEIAPSASTSNIITTLYALWD